MKKFIFIFMMMFAVVANAQQTTVEGSKVLDNTTVSLYGGGMGWINSEVVNESSFLKGVRPEFGLAVGKWFTPGVGAEVFFENSFGSLPHNKVLDRKTVLDMMNLGFNLQLNLNNAIHHYKGRPDLVEVVPFAGLGWGHGWTNEGGSNIYPANQGDCHTNFLTANGGIRVDFNVGQKKAWQINLRPSIHYMLAGEYMMPKFNSQKAYTALQVGVTYKFGHKNSKGVKTHNFTNAYTVAEYDDLQKHCEDLDNLLKKKPRTVEKVVEKVVVKTVETSNSVQVIPDAHFLHNQSVLDPTTTSVLDGLADEIKSNKNEYVITGYASVEGDEAHNKELSLARADAVKNYLVSKGVDANRLHVVGAGATDKFGSAYESNRRVVVEKK